MITPDHTLPASESTVPATDIQRYELSCSEMWTADDGSWVSHEDHLFALTATREQSVRQCAEIARSIATDVRNGQERFQAGVLASRLLSLIDRGRK